MNHSREMRSRLSWGNERAIRVAFRERSMNGKEREKKSSSCLLQAGTGGAEVKDKKETRLREIEGFGASKPPTSVERSGTSERTKSVWFLSHSCQAGQRATSISSWLRSASVLVSLPFSLGAGVRLPGARVRSTMKSRDGRTDGQVDKRSMRQRKI